MANVIVTQLLYLNNVDKKQALHLYIDGRYALPHATIHIHLTGGGKGYTEDVGIATREQERLQAYLFHLTGRRTRHSWKEFEDYLLRDRYLNAEEAKL